ncbi:MAG: 30S ribosomal protein S6 [Syntrophorhabdaceae bacterium]|nr:30S ribosomal protein S6 [Syntrophorhabdaceae bacterium]
MGRYENVIIISPELSKEEEDELLKRIRTNIEKAGGNIVRMDDWQVRRLAYSIKKKDKGHYFFILFDIEEGNLTGLGRFYKNIDAVLRYMFVRVDDDEKGPDKPPEQVVFDELEGEFA